MNPPVPVIGGLIKARRAKALSVDPMAITRLDLHGERDRARIFELLRTFDPRGLSDEAFAERTLALLDLQRGATPAVALQRHLDHFASLPPRPVPRESSAMLKEADDILDHRFFLCGQTQQLPPEIDWERQPGYELNRFPFLVALRAAWELTGQRKYAAKGVSLILDWIRKADVCDTFVPGPDPDVWHLHCKSPSVWFSHLEPAIHLVEWGKFLAALLPKLPDLLKPIDFLRILKSVHEQLVWLELIIPEGGHGNGLTAGTSCQLQTLVHFPFFLDASRTLATAVSRLEATLDLQILPDGAQHELTTHYHDCVTKDLLEAFAALRLLRTADSATLRRHLRKMLRYLRQTITPDGKQAAFGDGDAELGSWARQHLAEPAAREILGKEAGAELTSECFPCAGLMFMRQGSRHGKDELYLAFDGGPFGNCHQHEDKLSFWLSAYGRSFIVDPGRHMYDWSEKSFYPYLQTTKAHSTIRIDDRDQNSQAHPRTWVSWKPLPLTWQVSEGACVVAGSSYDLGYGKEQIAVRHARTIRFEPQPGYWIVEDEISGEGPHTIESRFQFAPGDVIVRDGWAVTAFDDANLALGFRVEDWDEVKVEKGQTAPRAGWYSPSLYRIDAAPALALYARNRPLPVRTRILLFPYRGRELPELALRLHEQHIGAIPGTQEAS